MDVVDGAGGAAVVADAAFREVEFGCLRFAIARGAAVAFTATKLSRCPGLKRNRPFIEDWIFIAERISMRTSFACIAILTSVTLAGYWRVRRGPKAIKVTGASRVPLVQQGRWAQPDPLGPWRRNRCGQSE